MAVSLIQKIAASIGTPNLGNRYAGMERDTPDPKEQEDAERKDPPALKTRVPKRKKRRPFTFRELGTLGDSRSPQGDNTIDAGNSTDLPHRFN